MEIKKKKNSFNEYTMEVSYGELEAVRNALSSNHTGPVADELFAGVCYFLDRLDPPGVDSEEDAKGAGGGEGEDTLGGEESADDILPAPPDDDAAINAEAGAPPGAADPAASAGDPSDSGEYALDYDDPDSILAAPPGA